MNRHDADALLVCIAVLLIFLSVALRDPGFMAAAAFVLLVAILVEIFGPETDQERARRRNQAHPDSWRTHK